jgi:cysteine desulfurase
MKIYLDNSSTTKQYYQVTEEMVKYMSLDYGNPGSLHRMGLTAEKAVEEARRQVAKSMRANEGEIFFTSGGTEADNTAIFGVAKKYKNRARRGNKIITTKVEHPAIMKALESLEQEGWKIARLSVNSDCKIDFQEFEDALDDKTVLVTAMLVNNEVGSIFPLEEISHRVRAYNVKNGTEILVHSDAIQGLGKVDLPSSLDMMSVSAHKIHGPKGIGALFIREGLSLPPFIVGGDQEHGFRSGTENVPAIVGFGQACKECLGGETERINHLVKIKEYFYRGIKEEISDILLNGQLDNEFYSPGILNLSFMGIRGEVLLHFLEGDGIYVSTGSACSAKHPGASPVLLAMGRTKEERQGAVRFSFSEFNQIKEMDYTIEKVKKAVAGMRRLGRFQREEK